MIINQELSIIPELVLTFWVLGSPRLHKVFLIGIQRVCLPGLMNDTWDLLKSHMASHFQLQERQKLARRRLTSCSQNGEDGHAKDAAKG